MIYMGIDPGLTGALAYIEPDESDKRFNRDVVRIFDTPTIEVDGKRIYMPGEMAKRVGNAMMGVREFDIVAILENVHSMPKQGVASSFNFGVGKGIWIGILAAYNIAYMSPSPQKWKKALGLTSDKNEARAKAVELYPQVEEYVKLVKHDGRAEALLMAHYGRLCHEGRL